MSETPDGRVRFIARMQVILGVSVLLVSIARLTVSSPMSRPGSLFSWVLLCAGVGLVVAGGTVLTRLRRRPH